MVTPSTYAHYKCNDDAGTNVVTDDGSGSNNGVSSVASTSTLSVSGKINNAFNFNGSSEYIALDGLATDIAADTTGSLSIWLNFTGSNLQGVFFSVSDTNDDDHLYMYLISNGEFRVNVVAKVGGLKWQGDSDTTASTGWNHFVITHDGTTPRMYVNGAESSISYADQTDKTAWFGALTGLDNGRLAVLEDGGGQSSWYTGEMDDVRYYQGQVLSLEDVKNIYRGGVGTEADPPPLYSPFPYSQGIIIT